MYPKVEEEQALDGSTVYWVKLDENDTWSAYSKEALAILLEDVEC